ncbi:DUF6262 family protein [Nocardia sp. NPDC059764]|uniref:DUF6262 family protein n=1 Tax=Nocardia sp. NPDC059764 TaxID=3346939 RepID=UPI003657B7EC
MTDARQRRIDTLKAAARQKSERKVRAAEDALRQLIKRGEPVTFQAVQRAAGVSQNFLYSNADLRARIEYQRRMHRPAAQPHPTGSDTGDNIVMVLTAQIAQLKRQHRHQVTELRSALEQAHGENLALRRELDRRGGTGS